VDVWEEETMSPSTILASVITAGLAFSQSRPAPVPAAAPGAASQATLAAGSPPDNLAWNTLREGLHDSDPEHRKEAIAAFETLGAFPQAVQAVAQALQDKDLFVKQRAAAALGEMGSKDAIPSLKAALDEGPEVSFTAAKSLWNLGDQADSRELFVEVLEGERKDTPSKIHIAVREAKKKLRPGDLALMGAKEAAGLLGPASIGIDVVAEGIKDNKKGSGAPGRAVVAGILAKDPDPDALALLEWATSDDSSGVRLAVAKALGERGNQDTIPKLLPLLSDNRHAVRYMAAASIVRLDAATH